MLYFSELNRSAYYEVNNLDVPEISFTILPVIKIKLAQTGVVVGKKKKKKQNKSVQPSAKLTLCTQVNGLWPNTRKLCSA